MSNDGAWEGDGDYYCRVCGGISKFISVKPVSVAEQCTCTVKPVLAKHQVIREFIDKLEEEGYIIVNLNDTQWMQSLMGTNQFMKEMGYE